jgi:hypothetical protein
MRKILLVCSVLLSIFIFVPGVLAGTTGTAAVTGNPALFLELTVTGSQSFGDLSPGDNVNSTANTVNATVVTNAPWAITVYDGLTDAKPGASVGSMAEWNGAAYVGGGKVLTDAFNVGSDKDTYNALAGIGSPQTLYTGIAGTFYKYPYFKQTIEVGDTRVGSGNYYRIVVTFAAIET